MFDTLGFKNLATLKFNLLITDVEALYEAAYSVVSGLSHPQI